MENIKMYEEFEFQNEYEMISIPKSVIEDWIEDLTDKNGEVVIVHVLDVQEKMKKFLNDYYDNEIKPSEPDDIENDITGADEDPTLIKKFEDE